MNDELTIFISVRAKATKDGIVYCAEKILTSTSPEVVRWAIDELEEEVRRMSEGETQ